MIDSPKTTLLNKVDDLNLFFVEGENELEFEIDDYSFVVSYSLEEENNLYSNEELQMDGTKKLKILSINAYDNIENEDFNIIVDDEIQKLFSDYYNENIIDDSFEPINVNFGEFSDFINS